MHEVINSGRYRYYTRNFSDVIGIAIILPRTLKKAPDGALKVFHTACKRCLLQFIQVFHDFIYI